MMLYSWLIAACWVVFFGYWIVSALGSRQTAISYGRHMLFRVDALTLILLFVRSRPAGVNVHAIVLSPAARASGVVVCATGIALAIWARRHLGKNWGMPMSVHEAPQLVMTGPYARLRHPIYTGIIVALIGNALTLSLWWLVAVLAAFVYFAFAAGREESMLLTRFPGDYAVYQSRTKKIVPGLF
jgi:protein-S-isoprenylcysteine O-methyltransferase Ste14